jgi:UDP:flavonoid glycosyltransferase YjiC (YdhE family)
VRLALVAGPDAGHAFPVIALGHALQARGHEVLVVTGPQWSECGLPWHDLPIVPAPQGESIGDRLWRRSVAMTPPLVEVVRSWGPQVVAADTLTLCGAFAAGVLGLPWVEVLPHPLQDPSVALPPVGHGLAPGTWWLPRRRDALLRRLTAPAIEQGRRERDEALRSLGLTQCEPSLRLVATLPALEHPRPDWPDTAHVVGALEWEPPGPAAAVPDGDGPLLLAASSTASGPGHRDLLGRTVEAARGLRAGLHGDPLPARVVATAQGDAPRSLPAWAAVSVGRQTELLDQATVVVCGGGGGILGKALSRGIPVVCVPGPGDQKENAGRVARLGAGLTLLPHQVTGPRLRAALQQVLTQPRFAMAAAAVARTGAGLGPPRAAALIETTLAARS